MEEEESTSYSVGFSESLSAPGLQVHRIKLRDGVLTTLLRKLSPPQLFDGTRLKVTNL